MEWRRDDGVGFLDLLELFRSRERLGGEGVLALRVPGDASELRDRSRRRRPPSWRSAPGGGETTSRVGAGFLDFLRAVRSRGLLGGDGVLALRAPGDASGRSRRRRTLSWRSAGGDGEESARVGDRATGMRLGGEGGLWCSVWPRAGLNVRSRRGEKLVPTSRVLGVALGLRDRSYSRRPLSRRSAGPFPWAKGQFSRLQRPIRAQLEHCRSLYNVRAIRSSSPRPWAKAQSLPLKHGTFFIQKRHSLWRHSVVFEKENVGPSTGFGRAGTGDGLGRRCGALRASTP